MTWQHFQLIEFRCAHCHENYIDHEFVDLLDDLRAELGFPLVVTSGYRCPAYNNQVSTTGLSGPHTTGRAADFSVSHERAFRLMELAFRKGFTGIGSRQHGDRRFIHLDNLPNGPGCPRPRTWSYP